MAQIVGDVILWPGDKLTNYDVPVTFTSAVGLIMKDSQSAAITATMGLYTLPTCTYQIVVMCD